MSVRKDLMQVLTVIAMERPLSFSAEDIRDEKVGTVSNVVSSSLVAFNLYAHVRSRFYAQFPRSRRRTSSLANMWLPRENLATSMTKLSRHSPGALLSL